MMKIQIIDRAKKKKILEELKGFGLKNIPELLLRSGRERIRAYSGSLSNEEIIKIWRLLPIEGIGLYIGKEIIDRHGVREVRLSLDGLHLWQSQINDKIIEINEDLENEWFRGDNLDIRNLDKNLWGDFVAVKSKSSGDFIGMGKLSVDGATLFNFLPKERRRRSRII